MHNDIYTVYVLFSFKNNIFYTGYTSNLVKRFNDHNYNNISGFTVKCRPWVVLYSEIFYTKSDALSREKYLNLALVENLLELLFFRFILYFGSSSGSFTPPRRIVGSSYRISGTGSAPATISLDSLLIVKAFYISKLCRLIK